MKKILLFAIICIAMCSCGEETAKTIQIDSIPVRNRNGELVEQSEADYCNQIATVVPGAYEMKWDIIDGAHVPPLYYVTLNIKLKLNTKLEVINENYFPIMQFSLVNAEGQPCPKAQGAKLNIVKSPADIGNSEAILEMFRKMVAFLTSEPGTEEEFTIYGTVGPKDKDWLDDVINNAAGLTVDVWAHESDLGKEYRFVK